MYKPEWKIQAAKDLEELQTLVNKIQEEGYVIEDINTSSLVVVYYKYTEGEDKKELLLERQDEGRIPYKMEDDYPAGFGSVDRDYGQQSF